MKKILPYFFIIFPLFFATSTFAASLEIAKDSGFSQKTDKFLQGETIYARVGTDNEGVSGHTLNLRDNEYNLITSYNLNRSGDYFNVNFAAPNADGYYSLETVIKSEGSNVTSVKTIKVGNSTSASVKVNVNNNVKGTKNTKVSEVSNVSEANDSKKDVSQSQNEQGEIEVYKSEDKAEVQSEQKGIFSKIGDFFSATVDFLWPF
mgnify:CR=1 FL=1